MITHADKTHENKSHSMAPSVSKKQNGGESTLYFLGNSPEAIAQRKLQEMAKNSPWAAKQLSAFPKDKSTGYQDRLNKALGTHLEIVQSKPQMFNGTRSKPQSQSPQVVQRKPTKQVTKKEIKNILDRMENEELRQELRGVAEKLIASGSLWFDDEINHSCAYPDPQTQTMKVVVPARVWSEYIYGDKTIERDAITIHELTHAAEAYATTGGDFSNIQGNEMDTDMVLLGPILNDLQKNLDEEKKAYEGVKIELESVPYKNLYEFVLDRLVYAEGHVNAKDASTREFPTVVNQIIHMVDKKAPDLKSGKLYKWLTVLQQQAGISRKTRQ